MYNCVVVGIKCATVNKKTVVVTTHQDKDGYVVTITPKNSIYPILGFATGTQPVDTMIRALTYAERAERAHFHPCIFALIMLYRTMVQP